MKFKRKKKNCNLLFSVFLIITCLLSCAKAKSIDDSYYKMSSDKQAPLDVWDGTYNIDWYSSDKSGNEYTISSANELAGIAYLVNTGKEDFFGKKINLECDVFLNNKASIESWKEVQPKNVWEPIGVCNSRWDGTRSFKGHFNGNNHTIFGMYIGDSIYSNPVFNGCAVGFFGSVETTYYDGIFLSDIVLSESLIHLSGQGTSYVGSLAGTAFGGGLFGYKNGVCNAMSNCLISIEKRIEMVGGLIGLCAVNCFNSCFSGTFDIPFQTNNFGGLTCGGSYPHFLLNCYLASDVSFVDHYRLSSNGALTRDGIPLYCSFFSSNAINSRIYGIGKSRKNEKNTIFWPSGNYKFSKPDAMISVSDHDVFVVDDVYFACDNRLEAKYPQFVKDDYTLIDALNSFSLKQVFGIEDENFFRKWISDIGANNGYPFFGDYR